MDALIQEIELRKDYLSTDTVDTIYLGGGTPSMLNDAELDRLFSTIDKHFKLSDKPEITLEANPDDTNPAFVKSLKQSPVNRISLGVQSFHDEDLHYLNRVHTAAQAHNSIDLLRDSGLENLTVDLIFGMPTLPDKKWSENLNLFFSLDIPHLSAYALTIEPKTPLEVLIRKGKLSAVDEERMVTQFYKLVEHAEMFGYLHYETSNYCKPGSFAQHNTNYWQGGKYLGLGPSAHSFNVRSRQWNIANLKSYVESSLAGNPAYEKEELSIYQQFNEYIMVSLRTMWGIDAELIKTRYGDHFFEHVMNELSHKEIVGMIEENNGKYTLTKKGKIHADGMAVRLFWPTDEVE